LGYFEPLFKILEIFGAKLTLNGYLKAARRAHRPASHLPRARTSRPCGRRESCRSCLGRFPSTSANPHAPRRATPRADPFRERCRRAPYPPPPRCDATRGPLSMAVPSPRREMTPLLLVKWSRAPHACSHTLPPLAIAAAAKLPCPLDFPSCSATQAPPLEPTRASTAARCLSSPPPSPECEPWRPQPACSTIRTRGLLLRPNLCIPSTLGALPYIPEPLLGQERWRDCQILAIPLPVGHKDHIA
jgi:hypothetical protein